MQKFAEVSPNFVRVTEPWATSYQRILRVAVLGCGLWVAHRTRFARNRIDITGLTGYPISIENGNNSHLSLGCRRAGVSLRVAGKLLR